MQLVSSQFHTALYGGLFLFNFFYILRELVRCRLLYLFALLLLQFFFLSTVQIRIRFHEQRLCWGVLDLVLHQRIVVHESLVLCYHSFRLPVELRQRFLRLELALLHVFIDWQELLVLRCDRRYLLSYFCHIETKLQVVVFHDLFVYFRLHRSGLCKQCEAILY